MYQDDILHPAGFEAVLRAKKEAMAKPVWPPLTLYAKLNTDPAFKLAVQTAVKTALDDYEEVRRPASQPAGQPAAQPAVELLLTSLLLPPPPCTCSTRFQERLNTHKS